MNLLPALALALSAASQSGDDHLVAGARHFREARYAEALLEFRVARNLGARDAGAYAGAALVKLGRFEEALEAFAAEGPPGRDALLDYYRALACHGARLYGCADAILAGIGGRSGPKLAEQAARARADLRAALAAPPEPAAIASLDRRCGDLRRAGKVAIADLFCQEAAELRRREPPRSPPAPPSPQSAGSRP